MESKNIPDLRHAALKSQGRGENIWWNPVDSVLVLTSKSDTSGGINQIFLIASECRSEMISPDKIFSIPSNEVRALHQLSSKGHRANLMRSGNALFPITLQKEAQYARISTEIQAIESYCPSAEMKVLSVGEVLKSLQSHRPFFDQKVFVKLKWTLAEKKYVLYCRTRYLNFPSLQSGLTYVQPVCMDGLFQEETGEIRLATFSSYCIEGGLDSKIEVIIRRPIGFFKLRAMNSSSRILHWMLKILGHCGMDRLFKIDDYSEIRRIDGDIQFFTYE